MNPSREKKIRSVIKQSQPDLTVILENIADPLNISAVLRSCDAVGVREVFVVYTKDYLDKRGLLLGKRTSGGTFKWIDVYHFDNLEECMTRVKERYGRVLATSLGEKSDSLYELDLTSPVALLFGNEDEGVSDEALALSDGNFLIPQAGFAESLNISVACAVTLFEARRQRAKKGFYSQKSKFNMSQQEQLFQRWNNMITGKKVNLRKAIKIGIDSAKLMPVYVDRDPEIPKKPRTRPNPMSKFDL